GIVGPWTARQCRPLGATMERRNPARYAPGRIEGQVFLVPFGTTAKRNSPGRAKLSLSGNSENSSARKPQAQTQTQTQRQLACKRGDRPGTANPLQTRRSNSTPAPKPPANLRK